MTPPLLELRGVSYRHPVRSPTLTRPLRKRLGAGIHHFNLAVEPGEIIGLVGPNGAGKTTLLRLIAGLLMPQEGEIRLLGHPTGDHSHRHWARRHIGLMPEQVTWPGPGTPWATLERLSVMRSGGDDIGELLEVVGLFSRANSQLDTLSQGMKQRLTLAATLLGEPKLLLLDEPLNGLDPVAQGAFRALLRSLVERGHSVLISSHQLAELERHVDRVAIVNRGRLVITGTQLQCEKALGLNRKLMVGGIGESPEKLLSGVAKLTPMDCIEGDMDWHYALSVMEGRWSSDKQAALISELVTAGYSPTLCHFEPLDLETLLSGATGQSVETDGFSVAEVDWMPLKQWGVGEDE